MLNIYPFFLIIDCMQAQFSRTKNLLGEEALEKLAAARVAVFGLGGVGGACVEALARGGVGALDVVDNGEVELSNINRQILATLDNLGTLKVEEAAKRIASINPAVTVRTHNCFFLPNAASQFDFTAFDYVVDAVDTFTAKMLLIEQAAAAGTPIISCMGAGNKLDPTAFRVADIYDTSICPLAKRMRKECRKRGIQSLKVVYSEEPPLEPTQDEAPPPGRNSLPGSVSFVPPVAGYILASEVIKDLIA